MNKNKKYFLIYVVNILLGLLYISPLIWMVVSAFKPENRIFADICPKDWQPSGLRRATF